MIKLENLTKAFETPSGTVIAADRVNLAVADGEICVLLGPSGCGKTTTLKMINRLVEPTSGKIYIDGKDTDQYDPVELRRTIGYVIQQIGLFPNMTVEDNVCVVPKLLGWDKERARKRASELLATINLDPAIFLKRYPKELSGGQQQRVGVARALAADPPVLLMDEPFGAVDPINREVIQNQFLEMQRALKKTVLLVSHDIDEALKLGDRIAVFRQGRIVQCASPDELLAKPANEFVGSFVGQDRTLKRLLLVSAGDVTDQQPTITVRESTPAAEAFAIMDDNDMRAVTVVDGAGKPLGFVKRREARHDARDCAALLHPFRITGKAEDNLRVVLSRLYESNTSWMPIVDEEGRYNGEISQDYIAEYLSSGKTRRALAIHSES